MKYGIFAHEACTDAPRFKAIDPLWARYIRGLCASGENAPFRVNGGEYEILLNLRHTDPRAAEMALSLRLRVLPDGTGAGGNDSPLTGREKEISDICIAGVTHEIACMRFQSRLPGYPMNVYELCGEDWSLYSFARERHLREPDGVHTLRSIMIRIPDFSNVIELPESDALAAAV